MSAKKVIAILAAAAVLIAAIFHFVSIGVCADDIDE
mgnify:FL=1